MDIKEKVVLKIEDTGWINQRLDKVLLNIGNNYSRTFFQELIADGLVKVNGRQTKNNYRVKLGDELCVEIPSVEKPLKIQPQKIYFDVVDVRDKFLIINKPAGLLVHPPENQMDCISLVGGLLYHFKEFEAFNEGERPGIVHRLDKDTSGLLLVARNRETQAVLIEKFKKREIKKKYLTVVEGHPPEKGKIDFSIGRHPIHRHKMSHFGIDGKPALTFYKVIKYYRNTSLVEVNIITGRTHQIRVHFAAIGHPVVGDSLYGKKSKYIKRQALHSWKLEFDFEGKDYFYCSEVPWDMKKLLKFLNSQEL